MFLELDLNILDIFDVVDIAISSNMVENGNHDLELALTIKL